MNMTAEEFLKYLESDKINPMVLLDFIYANFSYYDISTLSQTISIIKFCNVFGFETYLSTGKELKNCNVDAMIGYNNKIKKIFVSNSLNNDERKYIILYLIIKFLMVYKYFKNGGDFLASAKLDENYDVIYEIIKYKPTTNEVTKDSNSKEKNKVYNNVIYFPKK